MKATWDHWSGRRTVSVWYIFLWPTNLPRFPCCVFWLNNPTSPRRKKMNRMCEDSCYSQIFFFILYSLRLPFFLFFLPWLTELSCAALSVWARAALLPPRSAGPQCSILTQLTAAPTPSQWILLRLFVRTQFCFVLFEKSLVKCKREDVFFLLIDDTAQWWFKVMYVK